jgi:hypothetical protein
LGPPGSTFALNECGIIPWRLVLDDGPDIRVVEANLQRASGDDDLRLGINASILTTRPRDREAVGRTEGMTKTRSQVPDLAVGIHRGCVSAVAAMPEGGQWSSVTPVVDPLCTADIPVQTVGHIEIVCERKDFASASAGGLSKRSCLKQACHEERHLNRG